MAGLSPLPRADQKATRVRAMFDAIAPRYELLNHLLTFGMDAGWRRRTVAALALPRGSLVYDLACGTGDLCRALEVAGYRVVGFDFSAGMLAAARTGAQLVNADILDLPVPDGEADGATCGFALRNVVDLPRFFAELARVVRRGGRVGLLEVTEPEARLPRALHHVYFHRMVPLVGGLLSDREAYRYLPASTAYLPPPERLLQMLRDAGFPDAERRLLGLGAAQLIVGTRA